MRFGARGASSGLGLSGACLALSLLVPATAVADVETTATSSAAPAVEDTPWYDGWVAVPILFYTPETRLGFGAMAVYTFAAPGNGPEDRTSSLRFQVFYTLERQTSFYIEPNVWMFGDDLGITGFFEGRLYPFKFYGVGNDPDLDVFDTYEERVFEAIPQVTYRVFGDLRLGLNLHVLAGTAQDYPQDGLLVSQDVVGLDGQISVGLGPSITYDNRDSNFWPRNGVLASLDLTFYDPNIGSDFDFRRFTASVSGYLNPWLSHVVALQAYAQLSQGEVPFNLLPNLGGTRRHRGWFFGSLRDQHALLVQAEYRAPLWWRLGAVVFGSLGQVVPDLGDIDPSAIRGSVGGGLRFRLNDEGVNIRVDVAYGGRTELYFQIGEAF